MKKGLVLATGLVIWGICACAASPTMNASADRSDPGDRELQKGIYWYQKGCPRKALDHLHAAHELYSLTDRQVGVARSLSSLANVYRQSGDAESAMLFYDAAITAARRCDDQAVVAQALSNKAALLIDSGDLSGAEVLLDEAQLLSRERGPVLAMILSHRAGLKIKALHFDEAAEILDQAETVAANTLGAGQPYEAKPWFWSDQYDLKLQIVGLAQGYDRVILRGDPAGRAFSCCYLSGDELIALDAVNHVKDFMTARRLIAVRARFDLTKLGDPEVALKDAVLGG